MPLREKVLIVSLAVSTSRSVTRMKKEPSVAELESRRVVPRLDSSTKRGWLISTAVLIQEGHLANPIVLQALLESAGSLPFIQQFNICCVRSRIFIPFGLETPMPHLSRVRQFVSAETDRG